jgi:hypothetical protein
VRGVTKNNRKKYFHSAKAAVSAHNSHMHHELQRLDIRMVLPYRKIKIAEQGYTFIYILITK